jgi:hypothetical protein
MHSPAVRACAYARRRERGLSGGIHEKLRRADEHLTTLNDEVAADFEGEPHKYVTDADHEAGTYTVRVGSERPRPVRLGVICCDYHHCLRSVLGLYAPWRLVVTPRRAWAGVNPANRPARAASPPRVGGVYL